MSQGDNTSAPMRWRFLKPMVAGLIALAIAVAGWVLLSSTVLAPLVSVDLPIAGVDEPASPVGAVSGQGAQLKILADDSIAVGSRSVQVGELISAIEADHGDERDIRIVLAADKGVTYPLVMRVMDLLHEAGYRNVGLTVGSPRTH